MCGGCRPSSCRCVCGPTGCHASASVDCYTPIICISACAHILSGVTLKSLYCGILFIHVHYSSLLACLRVHLHSMHAVCLLTNGQGGSHFGELGHAVMHGVLANASCELLFLGCLFLCCTTELRLCGCCCVGWCAVAARLHHMGRPNIRYSFRCALCRLTKQMCIHA